MKVREFSSNIGNVTATGAELYGIELEAENARLPDCFDEQDIWRYADDGSLRNSGMEFVSRPLIWQETPEAIGQFYRWMSQYDYRASVRTSTHVHVNVLDYDMREVGAALTMYAILEPVLFRLCGTEREENVYCVPWYRAASQAVCAGRAVNDRWHHISSSCKYSALYLEPLSRFGTLEFRQAPLFTGELQLRLWLRVLRALVHDTIRIYGDADSVLMAVAEHGCDHVIETIFTTTTTRELLRYCGQDFESIIDNADSITIAENISPSLCTYKVKESDWVTPAFNIAGDGAGGYRNVVFDAQRRPMYEMDEPDEYYDGPDEDYEEMY